MWVRHRSVVIVILEGDLEFRWDLEMCWSGIHVTIKLVSETTRRSVIESRITHVSSSPWETVLREICFLVDLDRRKKMRRVCLLDSRCVFLSFSSPTSLPYPSVAQKEHAFSADTWDEYTHSFPRYTCDEYTHSFSRDAWYESLHSFSGDTWNDYTHSFSKDTWHEYPHLFSRYTWNGFTHSFCGYTCDEYTIHSLETHLMNTHIHSLQAHVMHTQIHSLDTHDDDDCFYYYKK